MVVEMSIPATSETENNITTSSSLTRTTYDPPREFLSSLAVTPFILAPRPNVTSLLASFRVSNTPTTTKYFKDILVGEDFSFHLSGDLITDVGSAEFNNFNVNLAGHNFIKDLVTDVKVKYDIKTINPFTRRCNVSVDVAARVHPISTLTLSVINATLSIYLHDDAGVPGLLPPLKEPAFVANATTVTPPDDPEGLTHAHIRITDFSTCLRIAYMITGGDTSFSSGGTISSETGGGERESGGGGRRRNVGSARKITVDFRDIMTYISFRKAVLKLGIPSIDNVDLPVDLSAL